MQKKFAIPTKLVPLVRFFLFQMAWWLLVRSYAIEAAVKVPHYSNILAVTISVISTLLILGDRPGKLPRLGVLTLALIGFLTDSVYFTLGLIDAEPSYHIEQIVMAPLWLLGLWLAFAAAIRHTVNASFLKIYQSHRSLLTASLTMVLMGAILGPVSYLAGEPLGVLQIFERNVVWFLAFEWAIFFPAMFFVCLFEWQKKSDAL